MEKALHDVLDELGVDYDDEVQLPGHRWRLDFVVTIGCFRWCIELDGVQHFDHEAYYNKKGGDGAFEKRVAVDREKDRICLARGDHVIRIAYDYPRDKYKQLIQEALKVKGPALTLKQNDDNRVYDKVVKKEWERTVFPLKLEEDGEEKEETLA